MNGNHEDIKIWNTFIKNKIVLTWNKNGHNENIKTKIKKNDIIAWYIKTKGFNSILKVIDTPKILNENQVSKYYPAWKHKYKTLDVWKQHSIDENYERICISVEFLATTDKHFVNQSSIKTWTHDWTIGLRGPRCMRPSNPHWKEQVIEIYKYIKGIQPINDTSHEDIDSSDEDIDTSHEDIDTSHEDIKDSIDTSESTKPSNNVVSDEELDAQHAIVDSLNDSSDDEESDSDTDEEDLYTEADLTKMKVPNIKKALKESKIDFKSKDKKAVLIQKYLDA